jgi:hypothetical protein
MDSPEGLAVRKEGKESRQESGHVKPCGVIFTFWDPANVDVFGGLLMLDDRAYLSFPPLLTSAIFSLTFPFSLLSQGYVYLGACLKSRLNLAPTVSLLYLRTFPGFKSIPETLSVWKDYSYNTVGDREQMDWGPSMDSQRKAGDWGHGQCGSHHFGTFSLLIQAWLYFILFCILFWFPDARHTLQMTNPHGSSVRHFCGVEV